ncbi:MAG TPA: VWA domain-containing protein, partial [Polyangiaceae bacterium]|nr:VWA domain-containing protein [Polyangiaceae bacterium]
MLLAAACSSNKVDGSGVDNGSGGTQNTAGSSGLDLGGGGSSSGKSGTTAGSGGTGGNELSFGGDDGSGNSPGTGGSDSCASATQETELSPVYLVFLLDESGSMGDGEHGQRAEKWDPVTSALKSFFSDAKSTG